MILQRYFLVMGLPRSRTAWLANFLTNGPAFCFHEPMVGCRSVANLRSKFERMDYPVVGGADTGAAAFADRIAEVFTSGIQLIIVERDPDECLASLRALGLLADVHTLAAGVDALEYVKCKFKPLVVSFDSLNDEHVGRGIWEHCIGEGFDVERFRQLCEMNIQVIPECLLRRIRDNWSAIAELTKERAHVAS